MAAEVLIAMMIISLGVFVFYNYRQTYNDIHSKKAEQQLVQFNSKYTKYLDSTDLTIYDVRTIVNTAKKDNETLDESEKIVVTFNGTNVMDEQDNYWDSMILGQVNSIRTGNTELPKYKFMTPGYDDNGKIKTIRITN